VDGVVVDEERKVLLSKRDDEPFKGYWHIPGGVVRYKERVEEAVERVMEEEVGIRVKIRGLIGVYSDFKRDPRGHYVTVAFLLEKVGGKERGGRQSEGVKYFKKLPKKMGFDARQIAEDGLKLNI